MRVGIPTETENHEYRVAITPAAVDEPSSRPRADRGWRAAPAADPALARGLSTVEGPLTSRPVGEAHGNPVLPVAEAVARTAGGRR